jgi:hypothetical protein
MDLHPVGIFENSPAIYGWVDDSKKPSPVRDERIVLSSLTGLLPNVRQTPSLERLGYFQTTSAVRRGIVVAAKIKQGLKLRLVAVRKDRNRPPRRDWGIGWRGWLQRFRS